MKKNNKTNHVVKIIAMLLGMMVFVIANGCNTRAEMPTTINMDFPHGETRLLVNEDGTAFLFYASRPQHEVVRPNTFELDELFNDLQDKLNPNVPMEERPVHDAYGMVTFRFSDGREEDYLIYDGDFAEAYFEIARANIIGSNP